MEKFNPSNPEYKKVEDLPKEEQKNFVDVGDGFVGREAFDRYELSKESTEKSFDKFEKFKYQINRVLGMGESYLDEKTIDSIAENAHLSAKPLDYEGLSKEQIIYSFLEASIAYCERIYNEFYAELITESSRSLEKIGYKGYLIRENWHDFDELYGMLNGQKIRIQEGISVQIGNERFGRQKAEELFNELSDHAVNYSQIFQALELRKEVPSYSYYGNYKNWEGNWIPSKFSKLVDTASRLTMRLKDDNPVNEEILRSYTQAVRKINDLEAEDREQISKKRDEENLLRSKREQSRIDSLLGKK